VLRFPGRASSRQDEAHHAFRNGSTPATAADVLNAQCPVEKNFSSLASTFHADREDQEGPRREGVGLLAAASRGVRFLEGEEVGFGTLDFSFVHGIGFVCLAVFHEGAAPGRREGTARARHHQHGRGLQPPCPVGHQGRGAGAGQQQGRVGTPSGRQNEARSPMTSRTSKRRQQDPVAAAV